MDAAWRGETLMYCLSPGVLREVREGKGRKGREGKGREGEGRRREGWDAASGGI